jgi:hypothetical protein
VLQATFPPPKEVFRIRMESITHRKVSRPEANASPDTVSKKQIRDASTRGQFLYGDLFLAALLPPVLVMLAFGGRPMLIAICFGSMFTYIFDIFGAMEVCHRRSSLRLIFYSLQTTVLSIVVTLMCLWGTLLYAARFLLQESLLNLGVVFMLTTLIGLVFLALAGQFRALRIEFESSFYFIEAILMAVTPLVSSAILTWFIAVEFPSLDLSFAFCVCHFIYTQVLLHPRPTSHPNPTKSSVITHWGGGPYVLSLPMVVAVYLTPVILCPALHITMHHAVAMSSSLHQLFHFGLSCLFPVMTITLSAERQLLYWPEPERPILASLLFLVKVVVSAGLALCLQTNELLEDLKDFSGMQEPYASLVLLSVVLLLLGALILHRLIPPPGERKSTPPSPLLSSPLLPVSSPPSQHLVISGLLDACIAAAFILAAGERPPRVPHSLSLSDSARSVGSARPQEKRRGICRRTHLARGGLAHGDLSRTCGTCAKQPHGPPQRSLPFPGQRDGGRLPPPLHCPAPAAPRPRHLLAGQSLDCHPLIL